MSVRSTSCVARGLIVALAVTCGLACTSGGETREPAVDGSRIEPTSNWERDLVATALSIDLSANHGVAVLSVASADAPGASFEAWGLTIASVSTDAGPLPFRFEGGVLDLGLAANEAAEVHVDYQFERHDQADGVFANGTVLTWPYFCGNVFPCKSTPADGLTFELSVTGAPAGDTIVFPKAIVANAPSYMAAWAVGRYATLELGTTKHGRHVTVEYLPGEESAAKKGAAHLRQAFEWLEDTYGAYTFGDRVGSVSAAWGPEQYGGMEHHPLWHVASASIDDEEVHVHEAAHGWFGNGVRIACWEDLALAEGATTYLTARALEAVAGKATSDAIWAMYDAELDEAIATGDVVALPDGCGEIDVLTELFGMVPYMKGAYFFRDLELAIGRAKLDAALRAFYLAHVGEAARMTDLLAELAADTGFDPEPLADAWLRSLGRPDG
ncbi:MAG: peptidase M1 [Deltaproteobacteria bacterium]|nr:peptidase M1 [Deltaproteobacteria bacterium]